jgi:hypothetical protein
MKMKTKVEIIDEVEGQGKNHYRYEITRDSGEPRDPRRPSDKVQVTAQVRAAYMRLDAGRKRRARNSG